MNKIMTKTFFGTEAVFFINDTTPKIVKVEKLDEQSLAVKITFEAGKK